MATLYSHAVGSDSTGWEGQSLRQLLPASGVASLGQIRVTYTAGSTGLQIDHASVALLGGAAFPNVTTTPPTALTFSGAAGFNLSAGQTAVSDWVTFTAGAADQLAFIADLTAGGTKGSIAYGAEVGSSVRYKVGASYQDATVSGFSTWGANTMIALVETQAIPSSPGGTMTMMGV